MTTRELLAPLIGRAEETVARRRADLASAESDLDALLATACYRGSEWIGVHKVELKPGHLYVVRRVRRDGERVHPAVAEWSENGWRVLAGYVPSGQASGDMIEVWQ